MNAANIAIGLQLALQLSQQLMALNQTLSNAAKENRDISDQELDEAVNSYQNARAALQADIDARKDNITPTPTVG